MCVKYNIEKPATEEDEEEEEEDDFAFGPRRLEDNQDSISSEKCFIVKATFLYCIVHHSTLRLCFHLFSLSLINIHSQLHLHINHLESLPLPLEQLSQNDVSGAQKAAEKQLTEAKVIAQENCSLQ